jgi:molybdopterin molybdotransferase
MIPLAEATSFVRSSCRVIASAAIPLERALGLVTATDLHAAESVPPFVNSAVDGYAVVAADTQAVPVELDVIATVAAGAAFTGIVERGQAVRIMTGAPMPLGADASVMVENTERIGDGSRVLIRRGVEPGEAMRGVGSDIVDGDLLFPAGTVLNAMALGVLASVNVRFVTAIPRLRVAVLSTGDELVDDGSPLGPGQIRESNKTMLVAAVHQAGCDVTDMGVVGDDEAALEAVLLAAAEGHDAIVTSGGVSMGDYDPVKAVLSRIAAMRWMQIAIKPAKPFAFGLLTNGDGRHVPVFGLPGNPVSSFVSFELLARPALRSMMGHLAAERLAVTAITDDPIRRRADGKTHYDRVNGAFQPDGRWHFRRGTSQGSHQLAASASANGLAIVPDGDGVPAGSDVDVMLFVE